MTMMSLLWRHLFIERSQLVQYFAHSFTTCQVLKRHCELRVPQKWMRSGMKNVKHQPFIFQHIVQIFLNTLIHIDTRRSVVRPHERRDCCDRWISRWNNTSARSFFINNTFSSTSKLLTPNMYCWSGKTIVTIYWTHPRVNGIWATSFCPEKMNNRTLFLNYGMLSTVASPYLSLINNVTETSS